MVEINLQVVIYPHQLSVRRSGDFYPPQHGFNTTRQLPGAEGLGHIIISTQLQAPYFVLLVGPHGEHDDGHIGYLANMPQGLKPIHLRHHHVQYHQIWQILTRSL